MNNYKVTMTYGTFYIRADYYSQVAGRYQFWIKKKVIAQYPAEDVIDVEIQNVVAKTT